MNNVRRQDSIADGTGLVGVKVHVCDPNEDFRGGLVEIHRDSWKLAPTPVQWDFLTTRQNVLRGVHVHCVRWDYIIVLEGHGTIGLKDIRRDQKNYGRTMVIDVFGDRPAVVTIPPGVAHGIFANTALRHLYGLTAEWDGSDEDLGCRYDDSALAISWPSERPLVLPRDLGLPDFDVMLGQYEARSTGSVAKGNAQL